MRAQIDEGDGTLWLGVQGRSKHLDRRERPPGCRERVREVDVPVDEPGMEPDGLAKGVLGGLMSAHVERDQAQAVPGLHVRRIERSRLAKVSEGFVVPPDRSQGFAQVGVKTSRGWVDQDASGEKDRCLLGVTALKDQHAKALERFERIRLPGEHFAVEVLGLGRSPLKLKGFRHVDGAVGRHVLFPGLGIEGSRHQTSPLVHDSGLIRPGFRESDKSGRASRWWLALGHFASWRCSSQAIPARMSSYTAPLQPCPPSYVASLATAPFAWSCSAAFSAMGNGQRASSGEWKIK